MIFQYQRELTSEEDFEKKRKVVSQVRNFFFDVRYCWDRVMSIFRCHQVIRRMLKHEESIIEVSQPSEENRDMPNEERILRLHPSYEIS